MTLTFLMFFGVGVANAFGFVVRKIFLPDIQIFGLKVLGTISGILQEETDLFQTQLLPFLRKSVDS